MSTVLAATALAAAVPASIPSPAWSGFSIGPVTVHAYALCILAGIIAAVVLTNIRWKRRQAPEGSIWDIAIWAIPFGIVGGRLYHVFSSPDNYFGPGYNGHGDLWLIPQIWRGGLGIWGAVVLGVVGAWIGCRRSGVKLTAFLDAAAPGLLLAQALGRWGNYFNQELFGGPTTLPWGLQIDPASPNFPTAYLADTLFHPTFLYESLWDVAGVALLLLLDRRFHFRRGRLFWLYAMYYTLGRFWIEMLRIDDAEQITFFGVTARLNVWTSVLVFLVSLLAFLLLTFIRRRSDGDSVLLPGRAAADNAETDDAASGDASGDAPVPEEVSNHASYYASDDGGVPDDVGVPDDGGYLGGLPDGGYLGGVPDGGGRDPAAPERQLRPRRRGARGGTVVGEYGDGSAAAVQNAAVQNTDEAEKSVSDAG